MEEAFFIRFHECIFIIYLISVLTLTIDVLHKNSRFQNVGFYTLGFAWVLQTSSLILYIFWMGQLPLTSIIESFYILTWLILTITFVFAVFRSSAYLIAFLNLIGLMFMAIHTFHPNQFKLNGSRLNVVNELLIFHISFALVSYLFFAIACVNAILYLIQFRNLKEKRFNQDYFRIGSVATLEKGVFFSSFIGAMLLLISILLGIQWGIFTIGNHIFIDLKVISSILILFCYGFYIIFRLLRKFSTLALIYVNIGLFICCMINLIVVTQLSDFHQWTGV
ncbi:cytochrome C assembly protein [Staphylococcus hyicus]|uniref:Cytochrome c biogenesis protein CcsA n=2 Tax=Staphylococcus hyicus TaxID=1284 RepID=A0ACD5FMK9_STAHY|nr:cytochrome c biogenesis protein CcsA [Staphylococcus hyicus]AJC95992.1 cytochrome C assembly protein [Staphylococcus hyicus]MCE5154826.1 cytochrome c biogenesis protein CcsA [Staphylococcus hyicus]MCQ9290996.1 cytochrome c biogenesis protein [Staphylococcus hyicus]MCQ9299726.1 cytochrome c biogenesis protein [Staphylococcus hyicus]MCQ9306237.1 cytochrome c biogenesis protein [Staphylococcus hyicus]